MIKVLQIIDGETFGGIAKLMLDISKKITDIDISFLTQIPIFDKNVKNAYNLGTIRNTLKDKVIYNYRLYRFLKRNKFDIVHVNSSVFLFSFQVVIICKLVGVKRVIVHSHGCPPLNRVRVLLLKVLNPFYRKITDIHLSCSKKAASSLFTKTNDVIVLKNGIDIDTFKYKKEKRNILRKQLNVENKKVYGHIGRFSKEKNHIFLVDVFYEIQKHVKDSILLLIGNGDLENKIRNKVIKLGISEKVLFLGFRNDIDSLLNVMDIFIFPSIYEGLPICLIEAQTSGLPVVVSKSISEEAKISENFYKIKTFNVNDWTEEILRVNIKNRNYAYKNTFKYGFNIEESAKKLEIIYKELI